jgi:hypothetical protein
VIRHGPQAWGGEWRQRYPVLSPAALAFFKEFGNEGGRVVFASDRKDLVSKTIISFHAIKYSLTSTTFH